MHACIHPSLPSGRPFLAPGPWEEGWIAACEQMHPVSSADQELSFRLLSSHTLLESSVFLCPKSPWVNKEGGGGTLTPLWFFRLLLKLPASAVSRTLTLAGGPPPSCWTLCGSLTCFVMNLLISLIANLKCLRPGLRSCLLPGPQHLEEGWAYRKEAAPWRTGRL